jgi:hypothetical protein
MQVRRATKTTSSGRLVAGTTTGRFLIEDVYPSVDCGRFHVKRIAGEPGGRHEFRFHFGDLRLGPRDDQRVVHAVENLVTGERRLLEWGSVGLSIHTNDDPALLFRCETQAVQ